MPAWRALSDYRVSVVHCARALSRAQHVISAIIEWRSRASDAGGGCGAKQVESLADQALQAAHDPYGHIGNPPRAAEAITVAVRVFLVLQKA
jgi:hypothetical protein